MQKAVCQRWLTKVRGIVGPDPSDLHEMIILNRILEWNQDHITLEPDPRDIELVLKEMGMEECKGSTCIHVDADKDDAESNAPLTREEQIAFRSIAARLNFLAHDRVDIQFACKEVCRRMAKPVQQDWTAIKKICRYLRQAPRMAMRFEEQEAQSEIVVSTDTDYAGCRKTRRSTNGGVIQIGSHMVKTWSTTQAIVALSSGEAEFYGLVKGACEAIGVAGLLEDLGRSRPRIILCTDSSAAKGIASRRGVGKVKHLETRTLWIQEHVGSGSIQLRKVCGQFNVADIATKYLSSGRVSELLKQLPLVRLPGRSRLAPQLQGAS